MLALLGATMAGPVESQVALLFTSGVAAGDVTPTSATLWTRVGRAAPVTVEVSTARSLVPVVFTARATPAPDAPSLKIAASGLAPGARHFYRFRVGGSSSAIGTFVTAPAAGARADLRLAFSGDADGTHVDGAPVYPHDVLGAIAAEGPDLFVFLGDTIYSDSPHGRRAETLEAYRAKYHESRSIPAMREALRATAVVAMWDDHEVENDFDRETVDAAKFAAGRRAFLEAWPITDDPRDRLYRSFRWGREAELFVLDLRSYRDRQVQKTPACRNPPGSRASDVAPALPAPLRALFAGLVRQMSLPVPAGCLEALNDPRRTLLGLPQKEWLKQGLRRSQATWKLIFSSDPIQEFFVAPYDRWEGYAAERAEVLTFIRDAGIKNVLWLAADTHAVLINDIRLATFPQPLPMGMKEVVVGPIATQTFGGQIARVGGPAVVPAFAAFLQAPPPQGVGMSCAELDRLTYAIVETNAAARTLTVTPKDAAGRPVCRAPLVLQASP